LPVLINGDDILFRADARFYEIWKVWVNKVGFTLSLGKNYIHPRFFTINSELYRHDPVGRRFVSLGFLNCGLLTGQSKVTGREKAKNAPIWDYYNKTVPTSSNPERTHRRFIHYHRRAIEEFTNRGEFNLFLPFNRGGLGFDSVQSTRVTSFQRRFATYLEKRYKTQVADEVIPKGETIGLVRFEPGLKSPVSSNHHPHILLGPPMGPLVENLLFYKKPALYHLPVLAIDSEIVEPGMKIRLPRRAKKDFRLNPSGRMGDKEIHTWPFRLIERTEAHSLCT